MKRIMAVILFVILLVACSPSPEQIAGPMFATMTAYPSATFYPTLTSYPTFTPYPTLTSYPTQTPYSTYTPPPTQTPQIIVVTATSSPTPVASPTITSTPTATPDPLEADKEAGFYLVGTEIAPGVWRSNGAGDNCYWAVTTKTGDIIDNHFGKAGGTMYVPPNGFQVELKDNCGTWSYMGQ